MRPPPRLICQSAAHLAGNPAASSARAAARIRLEHEDHEANVAVEADGSIASLFATRSRVTPHRSTRPNFESSAPVACTRRAPPRRGWRTAPRGSGPATSARCASSMERVGDQPSHPGRRNRSSSDCCSVEHHPRKEASGSDVRFTAGGHPVEPSSRRAEPSPRREMPSRVDRAVAEAGRYPGITSQLALVVHAEGVPKRLRPARSPRRWSGRSSSACGRRRRSSAP